MPVLTGILDHSDVRPRVPLKTVLISIAGLWACYFIIFTTRGWIVGLDLQAEMLWRRVAVAGAGMGATFLLWLVLRLFDHRSLALQVSAAVILAVPTSLLIAQTNQMVFADLQRQFETKLAAERGFSLRRDEADRFPH